MSKLVTLMEFMQHVADPALANRAQFSFDMTGLSPEGRVTVHEVKIVDEFLHVTRILTVEPKNQNFDVREGDANYTFFTPEGHEMMVFKMKLIDSNLPLQFEAHGASSGLVYITTIFRIDSFVITYPEIPETAA